MKWSRTIWQNGRLSPKEQKGIWLLASLLLLLILIRALVPQLGPLLYPTEPSQPNTDTWQAFLAKHEEKEGHQKEKSTKEYAGEVPPSQPQNLFYFNPNTIGAEELSQLGLTDRSIKTWLNYRKKGGRFYRKEDLQKLYNLSALDYQRLAPYVVLEATKPSNYSIKSGKEASPSPAKISIQLNTADSLHLKQLPGIGSVLSKRILAFREALGGFYSVEQLKEVYGLPPETFEKIKTQFKVDPQLIKKINLNTVDLKTLRRHPYFRPYAKEILQLRKEKGSFQLEDEIMEISLINDENYRKIAPYITL